MNFVWEVITDEERLKTVLATYKEGPIACDVETFGLDPRDGRLLGTSISFRLSGNAFRSLYIPRWVHTDGFWETRSDELLLSWLKGKPLVGHNFTYDKKWLTDTTWIADTRIMWHLASAPAGPHRYGLKQAQTELLGWTTRGDEELSLQVSSRGGSLKKGDHYLADVEVLGKYACLDTYSTLLVYEKLKPFFDYYEYWDILKKRMDYNELLELNTSLGIKVNVEGLKKAAKRLTSSRDAAMKRVNKQLAGAIDSLEHDWLDRRLAAYKRDYNRKRLLDHPEEWQRFNWNSDKDKRELFYDKLGNEVIYMTDGGLPSTNSDSVKQMKGAWVESYLKYEKANTLVSSFALPYLGSLRGDRLHPGFNICGTVSYRLSGFKPYLLNAPFDERLIMKNFVCDEGWVGVHADLASIEPAIMAHYSGDPTLLKVFRDGLGDVYLDLALEMFPHDKELRDGYNPRAPITSRIKERFAKQRKIAKVIQLAVAYTGTKKTVAKNLTKEGIPTTEEEADRLVKAYWKKFRKVAEFNYQLRQVNRRDKHLRNVVGMIIRVPDPEYKDLPNRFYQSSAHCFLEVWVARIYSLCKERGIEIQPVLLDCHDSTSNVTLKGQHHALKQVYQDALDLTNTSLGLSVPIRCEMKLFHTLAGLKGQD